MISIFSIGTPLRRCRIIAVGDQDFSVMAGPADDFVDFGMNEQVL
jgi:hypothetical protein